MRRELSQTKTLFSKLANLIMGLIVFFGGIKILLDLILAYQSFAAKIYVSVWLLAWTYLGVKLIEQAWNKKQIYIRAEQIIISNHFKEICIKKSDIEEIREKKYSRSGLVIYLTLKSPTQFGSEIAFIPNDYKNNSGGSKVVGELKS